MAFLACSLSACLIADRRISARTSLLRALILRCSASDASPCCVDSVAVSAWPRCMPVSVARCHLTASRCAVAPTASSAS